jgi:hypothetical protein
MLRSVSSTLAGGEAFCAVGSGRVKAGAGRRESGVGVTPFASDAAGND